LGTKCFLSGHVFSGISILYSRVNHSGGNT
jgi:hypothetical protein